MVENGNGARRRITLPGNITAAEEAYEAGRETSPWN